MNLWREDYLERFDTLERIIRMLSPADPERQEWWRSQKTLTEIAEAFCEKVMFEIK